MAGNMQYLIVGEGRVGVKLFNRGRTENNWRGREENWKAGMGMNLRLKKRGLLSALARRWWRHPKCQHCPSPHHNIGPRTSRHPLLLLFPNILLYTGHSWREARNNRAFRNWSFCKDFHYESALGSCSAAATMEVGSAGSADRLCCQGGRYPQVLQLWVIYWGDFLD